MPNSDQFSTVYDRPMWRWLFRSTFIGGAALMLTACGFADNRSPVPQFMRMKESEPPPLEPLPDVKRLVRENLSSVFVSSSNPREVRVSPPFHNLRGPGWNACVQAELTNVVGRPLGVETYCISISRGVIYDRQRVEASDSCAFQRYDPIQ